MTTAALHLALAAAGTGLIAALALALRPCVRDAVLRYQLMLVALLAACLLPLAQAAGLALPKPAERPEPVRISALLASVPSGPPAALAGTTAAGETPAVLPARPRAPRLSPGRARAAFGLYALGVLVAAAHTGARIVRSVALVRGAQPITDPAVLAMFAQAMTEAGVRRRVPLLQSDRVRSPAAWSLRRAAVVLPAGALRLAPDALRGVLHHELMHIRRHDTPAALAWLTLATALWFQPLLWLFGRALARDAEASCDALVVRATRAPRTYAHALLHFCGPPAPRHPAHAAMFASGAERSTRRRIAMLALAHRPAGRARSAASLAAALLLATGAVSAHATAAARLSAVQPGVPTARAAIEILAPGGHRDPRAILTHLLVGHYLSGTGTVTEAETVLSAREAQAGERTLTSRELLLSLPEGSRLRAIAEGDAVRLEPMERGARIILPNGSLRILDAAGVLRVTVAVPAGATLILETAPDAGEFGFAAAASGADGGPVAMTATLDEATGAPPEGADPAPGQTSWRFLTPAPGEDEPYRFKMQWHHDLSRVPDADEE